jgi:hypothetical protein
VRHLYEHTPLKFVGFEDTTKPLKNPYERRVAASGDLNPPNLGTFWARIEQRQSSQLCSDWQIQHIELSQTWVVRFPCAVSSKIFENPGYIGV